MPVNRDPADGDPRTEPEPPAVAALFGARADDARRYAELLTGPGIERGLIGPREAGRIWSRHLLNCVALAELVPDGARVVDIGSGAGLPGIPLALARPDIRVELVEPMVRRSAFLDEVVESLRLDTCRVIRARADGAAASVGGADVVTARAVARLATLAAWSAPLLRPGGILLALKGSAVSEELERDRTAANRAGIADLTVRTVGVPMLNEAATVLVGHRVTVRGRARSVKQSPRKR